MSKSISFSSEVPNLPHLIEGKGGLSGEVFDVRRDTDEALSIVEGRVGTFPELDWIHNTLPAAGGTIVLHGRNFLQGQTFDAATFAEASGGTLTITAMKPGDSKLKVAFLAASSTLNLAYDADTKTLTIRPAAGGSSDTAIATAINANTSPVRGILRAAIPTGGSTGNFTLAIAAKELTGGVGNYAQTYVKVGGASVTLANTTGSAGAAAWTDTIITAIVPDLTALTPALAATDVAAIEVSSNSRRTNDMTIVLTS